MQSFSANISGLTQKQVEESRTQFGRNSVEAKKENTFLVFVKDALKEPMVLILIAASAIYFIQGAFPEGIFLVSSIVLIFSISLYQESRSKNALEALKKLSQPKSRVIRDHVDQELPSEDIVVGDYIIVEEGMLIPADASIIQSNDFSVNEAILTGESLAVVKEVTSENKLIYQGTLVASGLAICTVTHIGILTRIGQIGKSLMELKEEKSPLQIQIGDFVKKMAFVGGGVFIIIWGVNFFKSGFFLDSLLKSLTLAMSILPEEIPVAFASFMALGAWRLMKLGVIVKQTKTVETLGSATVICVDKTGTITKNEMTLTKVYVHAKNKIYNIKDSGDIEEVVTVAMWASEPIPFDPMEKALHQAYEKITKADVRSSYKLVHEYPLSGKPPLMTHVFANEQGHKIIAAKGAPEALIALSNLSEEEKTSILQAFQQLANEGYRVLGVGETLANDQPYPKTQHEFKFAFKGLVAFYDPPKDNSKEVLQSFYKAGLNVKIITGDTAVTTKTIAKQIDFKGAENVVTGDELMNLSPADFSHAVANTNIFARMFPEAKLKIVQELKQQGEIVAMTGDGVNDGPALKAAHIGIAMGKQGSEIAKQASSLILVNDNLASMVDAIAMGRKIYNNLKKAIQYIISIHIPIILIVFIPLILGWIYPNIFSPVHVIFLELIMGPTCSIIYENEPLEKNLMDQKPRRFTTTFFNMKELSISIIQGLLITAGLVGIYWYSVSSGGNEQTTTSMVFITLIASNVLLMLVNRSFYYSIFTTLRYHNNLIPIIIGITLFLLVVVFTVPPLRMFFKFEVIHPLQLMACAIAACVSVLWFEVYKLIKRQFA